MTFFKQCICAYRGTDSTLPTITGAKISLGTGDITVRGWWKHQIKMPISPHVCCGFTSLLTQIGNSQHAQHTSLHSWKLAFFARARDSVGYAGSSMYGQVYWEIVSLVRTSCLNASPPRRFHHESSYLLLPVAYCSSIPEDKEVILVAAVVRT